MDYRCEGIHIQSGSELVDVGFYLLPTKIVIMTKGISPMMLQLEFGITSNCRYVLAVEDSHIYIPTDAVIDNTLLGELELLARKPELIVVEEPNLYDALVCIDDMLERKYEKLCNHTFYKDEHSEEFTDIPIKGSAREILYEQSSDELKPYLGMYLNMSIYMQIIDILSGKSMVKRAQSN